MVGSGPTGVGSIEQTWNILTFSGDVKRKGAYKNSRYYSIYGNPNAPFITQTKYVCGTMVVGFRF